MDNKDNYFKSEEFKDILHRYEEAENSGRHEYLGSDELTDIAEYYYNLGRNKESRSTLDYAISLHPGAAMPLVFRGRMALIDDHDVEKAKIYVNQITDQLNLDCL